MFQLQHSEFLDGSDLYRIYTCSISMRYFFDWTHIEQIIAKLLRKTHKIPHPTPEDILCFFNVVYSPHVLRDNSIDTQYCFNYFWFAMRLVLLSTYILHKRKMCYYCKMTNTTFSRARKLLFRHSWSKPDPNTDYTSFVYWHKEKAHCGHIEYSRAFSVCETCKSMYNFVSILSYCRRNGYNTKKFTPLTIHYNNAVITSTNGASFAPLSILERINSINCKHTIQSLR